MRQIIVQIALENVEHKEFVIKAINKWQSLIEDSDDCNNVPAISPLAVFNLTPTKDESE